ncbi:MAG: hypothetical protein RL398_383 [Planctomycetota bacterium]
MTAPSPSNPAPLDALLKERTRFRHNRFEPSCSSTQDLAAAAAGRGEKIDDGIVWTDHQTAGRGRQQRLWNDAPGLDLAATFRFAARLPRTLALPAATPVAVAAACEAVVGRPVSIKWPNDVFLGGRKLSGVLIDAGFAGPDTYLIGVGINCNRTTFPRELDGLATSLCLHSGQFVDRDALLLDLAVRLDRMLSDLAENNLTSLLADFRRRLGLLGRRVLVTAQGEHSGVLTDLDFGSLQLDGSRRIDLGLVTRLAAV